MGKIMKNREQKNQESGTKRHIISVCTLLVNMYSIYSMRSTIGYRLPAVVLL
jgi:hypothetical protein